MFITAKASDHLSNSCDSDEASGSITTASLVPNSYDSSSPNPNLMAPDYMGPNLDESAPLMADYEYISSSVL